MSAWDDYEKRFGNSHFILLGKLAVPEPDLMKWGMWFETANRHVADTHIGGIRVSTVFLGIDHQFGRGLPLLFETMVFRGKSGEETWRYETWQEAEAGHKAAVEMVRREIKDKVND